MPEPVMCPSCGESCADYPADGRCPKCGGAIPAPAKTPAPPPVSAGFEVQRPKRGIPPWAKLVGVLVFAIVATTTAVILAKNWGHKKRVGWVNDGIAECRRLVAKGNIGDAIKELEGAKTNAKKFDENDSVRAELLAKIDTETRNLRENVKKTLEKLVGQGDLAEAQTLYDSGVEAIDKLGTLLSIIEKGKADRKAMRGFEKSLSTAKVREQDGDHVGALERISELRKELESAGAYSIEDAAVLRAQVGELQAKWVDDARKRADKFLDEGNVEKAKEWFKTARKHVWGSESDIGYKGLEEDGFRPDDARRRDRG